MMERKKQNTEEALKSGRVEALISLDCGPNDEELVDHDARPGTGEAQVFFWRLANGGKFMDARDLSKLKIKPRE